MAEEVGFEPTVLLGHTISSRARSTTLTLFRGQSHSSRLMDLFQAMSVFKSNWVTGP